jgi:hypothetical protein
MYGDTAVIRALARAMRERATDLRAEADRLVGQVEAVAWTGLASGAMRRAALEHARGLRLCAADHETAAAALDHHAREVDHVKELIAEIERRVRGLIESVTSGWSGLIGHLAPDPLAQWVSRFEPPSPGSRAWLGVHVPRWL